MSRLTIRAEEDGVKAVWYGEREVFLEGEVGYAEADSANEAADEAKEQATTFVDDIDYVEVSEVYIVEE